MSAQFSTPKTTARRTTHLQTPNKAAEGNPSTLRGHAKDTGADLRVRTYVPTIKPNADAQKTIRGRPASEEPGKKPRAGSLEEAASRVPDPRQDLPGFIEQLVDVARKYRDRSDQPNAQAAELAKVKDAVMPKIGRILDLDCDKQMSALVLAMKKGDVAGGDLTGALTALQLAIRTFVGDTDMQPYSAKIAKWVDNVVRVPERQIEAARAKKKEARRKRREAQKEQTLQPYKLGGPNPDKADGRLNRLQRSASRRIAAVDKPALLELAREDCEKAIREQTPLSATTAYLGGVSAGRGDPLRAAMADHLRHLAGLEPGDDVLSSNRMVREGELVAAGRALGGIYDGPISMAQMATHPGSLALEFRNATRNVEHVPSGRPIGLWVHHRNHWMPVLVRRVATQDGTPKLEFHVLNTAAEIPQLALLGKDLQAFLMQHYPGCDVILHGWNPDANKPNEDERRGMQKDAGNACGVLGHQMFKAVFSEFAQAPDAHAKNVGDAIERYIGRWVNLAPAQQQAEIMASRAELLQAAADDAHRVVVPPPMVMRDVRPQLRVDPATPSVSADSYIHFNFSSPSKAVENTPLTPSPSRSRKAQLRAQIKDMVVGAAKARAGVPEAFEKAKADAQQVRLGGQGVSPRTAVVNSIAQSWASGQIRPGELEAFFESLPVDELLSILESKSGDNEQFFAIATTTLWNLRAQLIPDLATSMAELVIPSADHLEFAGRVFEIGKQYGTYQRILEALGDAGDASVSANLEKLQRTPPPTLDALIVTDDWTDEQLSSLDESLRTLGIQAGRQQIAQARRTLAAPANFKSELSQALASLNNRGNPSNRLAAQTERFASLVDGLRAMRQAARLVDELPGNVNAVDLMRDLLRGMPEAERVALQRRLDAPEIRSLVADLTSEDLGGKLPQGHPLRVELITVAMQFAALYELLGLLPVQLQRPGSMTFAPPAIRRAFGIDLASNGNVIVKSGAAAAMVQTRGARQRLAAQVRLDEHLAPHSREPRAVLAQVTHPDVVEAIAVEAVAALPRDLFYLPDGRPCRLIGTPTSHTEVIPLAEGGFRVMCSYKVDDAAEAVVTMLDGKEVRVALDAKRSYAHMTWECTISSQGVASISEPQYDFEAQPAAAPTSPAASPAAKEARKQARERGELKTFDIATNLRLLSRPYISQRDAGQFVTNIRSAVTGLTAGLGAAKSLKAGHVAQVETQFHKREATEAELLDHLGDHVRAYLDTIEDPDELLALQANIHEARLGFRQTFPHVERLAQIVDERVQATPGLDQVKRGYTSRQLRVAIERLFNSQKPVERELVLRALNHWLKTGAVTHEQIEFILASYSDKRLLGMARTDSIVGKLSMGQLVQRQNVDEEMLRMGVRDLPDAAAGVRVDPLAFVKTVVELESTIQQIEARNRFLTPPLDLAPVKKALVDKLIPLVAQLDTTTLAPPTMEKLSTSLRALGIDSRRIDLAIGEYAKRRRASQAAAKAAAKEAAEVPPPPPPPEDDDDEGATSDSDSDADPIAQVTSQASVPTLRKLLSAADVMQTDAFTAALKSMRRPMKNLFKVLSGNFDHKKFDSNFDAMTTALMTAVGQMGIAARAERGFAGAELLARSVKEHLAGLDDETLRAIQANLGQAVNSKAIYSQFSQVVAEAIAERTATPRAAQKRGVAARTWDAIASIGRGDGSAKVAAQKRFDAQVEAFLRSLPTATSARGDRVMNDLEKSLRKTAKPLMKGGKTWFEVFADSLQKNLGALGDNEILAIADKIHFDEFAQMTAPSEFYVAIGTAVGIQLVNRGLRTELRPAVLDSAALPLKANGLATNNLLAARFNVLRVRMIAEESSDQHPNVTQAYREMMQTAGRLLGVEGQGTDNVQRGAVMRAMGHWLHTGQVPTLSHVEPEVDEEGVREHIESLMSMLDEPEIWAIAYYEWAEDSLPPGVDEVISIARKELVARNDGQPLPHPFPQLPLAQASLRKLRRALSAQSRNSESGSFGSPASPQAAQSLALFKAHSVLVSPKFRQGAFDPLLQSAVKGPGSDVETLRLYEQALEVAGGLLQDDPDPQARRDVVLKALEGVERRTLVSVLRALSRGKPGELEEIAEGVGPVSRYARQVMLMETYLGEASRLKRGPNSFATPGAYCDRIVAAVGLLKDYRKSSAKYQVDDLGAIRDASAQLAAQLEAQLQPRAEDSDDSDDDIEDNSLHAENLSDNQLVNVHDAFAELDVNGRDEFIGPEVRKRYIGWAESAVRSIQANQLALALVELGNAAQLADGFAKSRGFKPREADDLRERYLGDLAEQIQTAMVALAPPERQQFRDRLEHTEALDHVAANLPAGSLADEVASRAKDMRVLRALVFGPRTDLDLPADLPKHADELQKIRHSAKLEIAQKARAIHAQKAKGQAILMGDALVPWRGIAITADGDVIVARRGSISANSGSDSDSTDSDSDEETPNVTRRLFGAGSPEEHAPPVIQPQVIQPPAQALTPPASPSRPDTWSRLRAGTARRFSGLLNSMSRRNKRVDSKMSAAREKTDAHVGKLLRVFSQRKDNFFDGRRQALLNDREAIIRLINGLGVVMKPITSRSTTPKDPTGEEAGYREFAASVDRSLESMSLAQFFALQEGLASFDQLVPEGSPQRRHADIVTQRVLHHLYGDLPPLSADRLREIAERVTPQTTVHFVAAVQLDAARMLRQTVQVQAANRAHNEAFIAQYIASPEAEASMSPASLQFVARQVLLRCQQKDWYANTRLSADAIDARFEEVVKEVAALYTELSNVPGMTPEALDTILSEASHKTTWDALAATAREAAIMFAVEPLLDRNHEGSMLRTVANRVAGQLLPPAGAFPEAVLKSISDSLKEFVRTQGNWPGYLQCEPGAPNIAVALRAPLEQHLTRALTEHCDVLRAIERMAEGPRRDVLSRMAQTRRMDMVQYVNILRISEQMQPALQAARNLPLSAGELVKSLGQVLLQFRKGLLAMQNHGAQFWEAGSLSGGDFTTQLTAQFMELAAAGLTEPQAWMLNDVFAGEAMNHFIRAQKGIESGDAAVTSAQMTLPIMLDTMMLAVGRRAGIAEEDLDQRVRAQLRLPGDASALKPAEMQGVRLAMASWPSP